MQKNFIRKLFVEGKIKITSPSIDISIAYSDKSRDYLKGSKVLFKEELFDQSIVNAYYSMYYKILSLLYLIGLKCENHTGTIMLLKEVFGMDNALINAAKTERIDKQYYTDNISPEEAQEMIRQSEKFIESLEAFIDGITPEKGERYLEKSRRLFSL